ncbi:hypothetical protein DYB35_013905 [Aphanomyces astaci]|uniref:Uncharacterized protein n=1 Tax=Aphanomyces astaci TaxID=112090 RepID=A0A3R7APE7_APHAT|nr:hypothetical protein DYB35_013905 [Aphanomyces astaci]
MQLARISEVEQFNMLEGVLVASYPDEVVFRPVQHAFEVFSHPTQVMQLAGTSEVEQFVDLDIFHTPKLENTPRIRRGLVAFYPDEVVFRPVRHAFGVFSYLTQFVKLACPWEVDEFVERQSHRTPKLKDSPGTLMGVF